MKAYDLFFALFVFHILLASGCSNSSENNIAPNVPASHATKDDKADKAMADQMIANDFRLVECKLTVSGMETIVKSDEDLAELLVMLKAAVQVKDVAPQFDAVVELREKDPSKNLSFLMDTKNGYLTMEVKTKSPIFKVDSPEKLKAFVNQ